MLQPTLTLSGISLMVKAFCGEEIQFTQLKIGRGSAEGIDTKSLTDLINPIKNISISRIDRNDNNVTLVGTGYNNSDVENDITWNEVGVYATDPDEGEILFAYVNTEDALEIIKDNQSGINIENNLSVMLIISSNINVSAVIKSIQYASKQDLLDHISNKNNPHGLTKKDFGLEKVENLAISDQVPNFDTGSPLENIKKGDTIKKILTKVWSAIDKLTNHINNSKTDTLSLLKDNGFDFFKIKSGCIASISDNHIAIPLENGLQIVIGRDHITAEGKSDNVVSHEWNYNYFSHVPFVFVTINTQYSDRYATADNITRKGFNVIFHNNRSSSSTNYIYYMAIG
ncbi:MAG: hypothetical protein J1E81_07355 [Eubacterium sp.]|nr:hypothetical protein [Eubacterium sp.]